MQLLKPLISRLFGTNSTLSSIDKIVLDSVKKQLHGNNLMLWDSQIKAINKIQRLPEGLEVNFYRIKNGSPSFDQSLAFTNKTTELQIAEVLIELAGLGMLNAKVWCVKGFIFAIEYQGSVNYFEEAAGMEPKPKFTVKCDLTANLANESISS